MTETDPEFPANVEQPKMPTAATVQKKQPLAIQWTERTVRVADLKPYERNPRTISKRDFFKLKQSLRKTGYHSRILAQPDLRVIGGHMRIRALLELEVKGVVVLVPSRELSEEEFKQVLIQDNLSFGTWDHEILSTDFERDELLDFGMPEKLLDEGVDTDESGGGSASGEGDEPMGKCPKCGQPLPDKTPE